jgi:HEPN domain-containing protein
MQKTAENNSPSLWLQFSKEDLMAADVLFRSGIYNQVCFHAQQSIERSIKAFLFSKDIDVPRICRINDLLKVAVPVDNRLEKFQEKAKWIDKYYASTRYPDTPEDDMPLKRPGSEEAKKALRIAKTFYDYIISTHFKGKKIVLLFE